VELADALKHRQFAGLERTEQITGLILQVLKIGAGG
jgi:hypothetical protein